MATESARGPPRGRGRKEAWWEEGAGEAESAAPGSGVERSGDGTQRKAAGSAGSAVGAGIAAAATRERYRLQLPSLRRLLGKRRNPPPPTQSSYIRLGELQGQEQFAAFVRITYAVQSNWQEGT